VLSKDKNSEYSEVLELSPITKNEVKKSLRNDALNKVKVTWVRDPEEYIVSKKLGLNKLHETRIDPTTFTKARFFSFISFTTGHNFLGKHMLKIKKPGSIIINEGRCRFCDDEVLESSLHIIEECTCFVFERLMVFKKSKVDAQEPGFSLGKCLKFINTDRIKTLLMRYDHKLDIEEFKKNIVK
jgi:hypothetical protein